MSPDLVTQVVADQPQIVIISSDPTSAAPLRTALQEWQLDLVVLSPRQVTNQVLERAYKLVWILENRQLSDLQKHQAVLATYQTKLYLVFPLMSPIDESGPVGAIWHSASQEQAAFLKQLISWFGQASLVMGQDAVLAARPELPVFKVMTQAIDKQVVLDPNQILYLQTWEGFCRSAARLIIVPRQEKYLLQGKKTTTTNVVRLLQLHLQRLSQQHLTIETISVTPLELPLQDVIVQPTAQTLDLDEVVKDIAQSIASHQPVNSPTLSPDVSLPRPHPKKTSSTKTVLHTVSTPKTVVKTDVVQPPLQFGNGVHRIPKVNIPVVPSSFRTLTRRPLLSSQRSEPSTHSPITSTTSVTSKPTSSVIGELRPTSLRATKSVQPAQLTQVPAAKEAIEDEVIRLFQDYRSEHKVERVREVAKTTVKTTKKLVHKKKAFMGGLAFVGVGMAVVSLMIFFFVSTWQLKRSFVSTLAQLPTTQPSASTLFWSRVTALQVQAYTKILDPSYFEATMSTAELTASLPIINEHMVTLDKLAETSVLQALGRKDGEILDTLSELNSHAQSLYELLSKNQATLKTFSTDDLSEEQKQHVGQYESSLLAAKKALLPSQQLHSIMAPLLGETSKRTYAVVLQNNQELRPTGGFIQAVALVTFDQGMIIDTQVFNVYDLDNALTGAVSPPVEVTQLLGEKQWYLRDSNWNPDFPTTANTIAQFIERSTSKKIDGVLALNLIVVEDILQALGPVELPEYNEVITDRNLNERMEFHSEIQLAPNPDQPDYSTLFLNRLLQKITQVQPDKIPALLSALNHSFDEKQLLLSFQDPNELSTLSALGWTGALLQPSCPIQLSDVACVVDTIAQVETNVGINKANAYVERQISHTVALSPTQAEHQRQIVFTNKATSNAWPKGTYKSYVRLYVPTTAQLQSVTIDGTPLPPTQAIVKTEQNRQVFSFLVDVPIQKSVTVLATYTVPMAGSPTAFSYALFNQQQPGIEHQPVSISLTPTATLKPSLIAPQAKLNGQTILFNELSTTHAFVGVKF